MLVERKGRTAIKAISWRIVATLMKLTIVYAITGEAGYPLPWGI